MDIGHRQNGYVIVSVALTLALLCGFAALAVDLGLFLSARTSAQRAADAAALAGAFTFIVQPTAPQPETAQQHAISTALSNNILDDSINLSDVSVVVDVPNRLVTVDISHTRQTFFARVIGRDQVDIGVRANAEASLNATGSGCSKPWFVPNTILSPLDPCDACSAVPQQVLIDGSGNVTDYATQQILLADPFIIKPSNPINSLAPGQFYAIRMGDSTGGDDYRTNIQICAPERIYCQDLFGVEPGNMIGPTIQGVTGLIGPNPDTFIEMGKYQDSEGNISDTSHQLLVVPVWDTCAVVGFCPDNELPDSGANLQIEVIGFAMIFIEGLQGNNVMARLIWVSSCSSSGGGGGGVGSGPAPPETGPFGIPLRLVRLP